MNPTPMVPPFGGPSDAWRDMIIAHPTRFLSALDWEGDCMDQIGEYNHKPHPFLGHLPSEIRHRVAYENAWQLLFDEAFA